MKRLLAGMCLTTLGGCAPKALPPAKPVPSPNAVAAPAPAGGGGIAPMATPAAGGLTPVANSDSVEGAGMGGVGQVAKDQARRAAAGAAGGESAGTGQSSGE